MRLAKLVAALLAVASSLAMTPTAEAQDVLVCWGDSILAGFNNNGNTTTPWGPAPFGDPVQGAYRWDAVAQDWGPVTPYQNFQGTNADPVYGLAAGWRRFNGSEVYIISLGVPGSDASPNHPNQAGSWHPTVPAGRFTAFEADYLEPALATLAMPEIRAVFFTAGNNAWTSNLGADLDDIHAAILSHAPWSTPSYLGVKTYFGTPLDANTVLQRQSIDAWVAAGTGRYAVETLTIPGRTGGFVDGTHVTHFGAMFIGFWGAVTEFFHL